MSAANKLVPQLRFPEFRGDGEWCEEPIGKAFRVTRGNVLSMKLVNDKQSSEFPFPVYSSQTKNNGLSGFYSEYLYEDAITWTTDGANAGDTNFRKGKFYCTNVCGVLLSDSGFANCCMAELINRVSREHVSYVGNPKLMNGVMANIRIPVPSLSEQKKIADCLGSVDALLTAHRRKLDALQDHKKGLLQQLFPKVAGASSSQSASIREQDAPTTDKTTPKRRFPGFAGEWEEVKIGDLGKVVTGSTPSTARRDFYDGPRIFVSPADISGHQFIEKTNTTLTDLGFEKTRPVRQGSTLFVCIGSTIGKIAQNREECATNQQINAVIPNSKFSDAFVFYCLLRHSKTIAGFAGNQAVPIINKSLFSSFSLIAPALPEQQKIADCLSSLDALITAQTEQIADLKEHKKGLMQKLFPNSRGK